MKRSAPVCTRPARRLWRREPCWIALVDVGLSMAPLQFPAGHTLPFFLMRFVLRNIRLGIASLTSLLCLSNLENGRQAIITRPQDGRRLFSTHGTLPGWLVYTLRCESQFIRYGHEDSARSHGHRKDHSANRVEDRITDDVLPQPPQPPYQLLHDPRPTRDAAAARPRDHWLRYASEGRAAARVSRTTLLRSACLLNGRVLPGSRSKPLRGRRPGLRARIRARGSGAASRWLPYN
ncbi:hypothetical protein DAEQUDRAFT_480378 [Daedalea quercina L-15889]|uniref:Uncharacterized protein n=1 Tax=Daedalea quercina L-15889 TaxID=1314783 RepID=A0A165MTM1_9APHY|nr:hypothetical protein DAEQUDRAFT_480378 [Daedalea quercina L-15889]